LVKTIDAYKGVRGERGKGTKQHPPYKFSKKLYKNTIKAQTWDPLTIFLESLDPTSKNLSYPLPWMCIYGLSSIF
jgi:hypothetical protein